MGLEGETNTQHLRARGQRRLELLDGGEVAAVLVGGHLDRDAAGEPDRLRVGRPVGRGQQRLVAGAQQGGEGLVERLLAAVGHEHLGGGDLQAGVAGGLGGDRLAELGQPAGRGVLVVAGVTAGRLGRGDDVVGGGEVGLARAEPDHRPAGGLERLRLGVDSQRGGLGDPGDPAGDAFPHGSYRCRARPQHEHRGSLPRFRRFDLRGGCA